MRTKMLVLQNINEFIKISSSLKTNASSLNHSLTIVLTNKLKQINNQFSVVASSDLNDDFFTNIHCILSQSTCVELKKVNFEDLLESCLDVLISALNTTNPGIRKRILTDFRFLPVVSNILR
jgi:hypothetical protein